MDSRFVWIVIYKKYLITFKERQKSINAVIKKRNGFLREHTPIKKSELLQYECRLVLKHA